MAKEKWIQINKGNCQLKTLINSKILQFQVFFEIFMVTIWWFKLNFPVKNIFLCFLRACRRPTIFNMYLYKDSLTNSFHDYFLTNNSAKKVYELKE